MDSWWIPLAGITGLKLKINPVDRSFFLPSNWSNRSTYHIPNILHSHLPTFLFFFFIILFWYRQTDGCVYPHRRGHTHLCTFRPRNIVCIIWNFKGPFFLWWRMMIVFKKKNGSDRGCSHYLDPTPTAEIGGWHFIALAYLKSAIIKLKKQKFK